MDRKYLFFDIDGTLAAGGYEHTYVPESTMLALRKLRKAGHFLCIATGRSNGMAVAFMDAFEIKNMVSDGGNGLTSGHSAGKAHHGGGIGGNEAVKAQSITQQPRQQPKSGMSEEQQQQLLNAIQAQEDKTQDKLDEKAKGVIIKGKKNW